MAFGEILVIFIVMMMLWLIVTGTSQVLIAKSIRRYKDKLKKDNKIINKILK